MNKFFFVLLCFLAGTGLISGCASVPSKTEQPLTFMIRKHPMHHISKGGCWAQYTVIDQTRYLLFFSPTRTVPDVTKYISELEEGTFTPVLRNSDIYIGAQIDVPFLVAIGGHSYADLAFANPAND
jgi:hypothetical protein